MESFTTRTQRNSVQVPHSRCQAELYSPTGYCYHQHGIYLRTRLTHDYVDAIIVYST